MLKLWVLKLLLSLAPLSLALGSSYPGWAETEWERGVRYLGIVDAITAATRDPKEIALLVAVAHKESAFARDVDAGECYRGPDGRGPRCDSGRAVSIWQIQAPASRRQALLDRRAAAREALRRLRASLTSCADRGNEAGLDVYASGRCAEAGSKVRKAGAERLRLANELLVRFSNR